MEKLELGQTVGILGGGQLARMLAEAALRLGFKPKVLAASSSDPAVALCEGSVFGSAEDEAILYRFLGQCERVVYENEFIACEKIDQVAQHVYSNPAERLIPSLQTLFEVQDKISQKRVFEGLGIATAPYMVFSEKDESLSHWFKTIDKKFNGQFVIKWALQGYDGYGTWIKTSERQASDASEFCKRALARKIPIYAEQKVDFERELALVSCYSIKKEFVHYPLVISEQSSGICRKVIGPAVSLGVSRGLEEQACEAARKVAQKLKLYGTFALEFFETRSGDLWVNELAPRVHNSGHFTQDACKTSQFENHWRAVLGMPLGEVGAAPAFAMLNLLGPDVHWRLGDPIPMPRVAARSHLHWYGKQGIRKGRKLGHINASGPDMGSLPAMVHELEQSEAQWVQSLLELSQRNQTE